MDSEGYPEEEPEGECRSQGKDPKSGIFDKASSTKLIRRVLHAHAMIDEDETIGGRDYSFHEFSFNMLVAGELEIILCDSVSANEKWSRLQLLKRLAYKVQFLDNSVILERYAAFLRKIEKGKGKWGSEATLKDFDESLRFRAFNTVTDKGGKGGKKWEGVLVKGGGKIYCLDFNRGKCAYPDSHEGWFNKVKVLKHHMCKVCWEKDGVERKHLEGSGECPNKLG